MTMLDRVRAALGDRSGDTNRQVRSGSADFTREPDPFDTPSPEAPMSEANKKFHARNAELDAHEKRTGIPASFMPNVPRTAPAGVSQKDHDRAIAYAHEMSTKPTQFEGRDLDPMDFTKGRNLGKTHVVTMRPQPTGSQVRDSRTYTLDNAEIITHEGEKHITGHAGLGVYPKIPLKDVQSVNMARR